jgi:isopentenyldiphosphate isomerase
MENEICPVFAAQTMSPQPELRPNPDEVMEFAWVEWSEAAVAMASTPFAFSPWAVEQFALLSGTKASDPRNWSS